MKKPHFILLFVFGLLLVTSCKDKDKSNLTLLSSEIPTDTALVFSPDIISTENNKDFAITFSPEMDELFFTRRKPEGTNEIYTSKLVDSKWSNPELAFFATNKGWDFQPHINPNGDRLYFGSTRPLNDTIKSSGVHEWYSKKNDGEWTDPKPLEKPFLDRVVMYLKSSKNDNLYFTSGEGRAKDGGIYYSINENGQYKSIKKMGEVINSNGDWIAHSYIAPDESYIIYSSETNKNTDLFISFNLNGTWTESYSMGPKINTEQGESAPSVSPDGKYFFFSRTGIEKVREDGSIYYLGGNIYWIDFMKLKKELLENM